MFESNSSQWSKANKQQRSEESPRNSLDEPHPNSERGFIVGAKDGEHKGSPSNLGCLPPGIPSACWLVLSWLLCFVVILLSHNLFTFVEHKLEASRPPSLCLYLHPSLPSSSSSTSHSPTPPTGSISIYLSVAPGCRRYKHFM